jgi:hypothetical protein
MQQEMFGDTCQAVHLPLGRTHMVVYIFDITAWHLLYTFCMTVHIALHLWQYTCCTLPAGTAPGGGARPGGLTAALAATASASSLHSRYLAYLLRWHVSLPP